MIHESQTGYTEPSTEDDEINKRIKAVGRTLSPTYVVGVKTQKITIEDYNEASAASLAAIQRKYGKPTNRKLIVTVGSDLKAHTTTL